MENNSGQGSAAAVPIEINKWNWGAFLLNWIWGIGNSTYIAFLMFVPLVNVVMMFVLGAKGSAWAWQNKRWENEEHFRLAQRRWAKWGVVVWLGFISISVAMFFWISAVFKDSEAYKLSTAMLESNEQVAKLIGKPISTGMAMGQMQTSGPRGSASLSYSVEGPTGTGTAYVEAAQDMGKWEVKQMVFEHKGSGQRIDLVH